MRKFGLIGHPIAHSGSPALFAEWCGGRWPYDLIEGADFEASWQRFLDGYDAINITAPFKEEAFKRVMGNGTVDEGISDIGAINIAVKTPDGIKGYNSDFLGVRKLLRDNGFGSGSTSRISWTRTFSLSQITCINSSSAFVSSCCVSTFIFFLTITL